MTKIMISAGEASGDVHAGALARELKKIDPTVEIFGMGGEHLREAGGEVLFDIKDHGVMGVVEVISNLPKLFQLRNDFERLMEERRPDCFVSIDYPDFNMRLAKIAKAKGIPVVSFISPSAWAWRKGRAKKVGQLVDKVAAIFPFEYDVYHAAGADTEFVGHPLVDIVKPVLTVAEAEAKAGKRAGHPLVLLMPGSRLQEIKKMLPDMLAAAKLMAAKRPELDFAMPKAGTIPLALLEAELKKANLPVKIFEGNNYDVMGVADVALASSGTVTLEAALCGLPCVICYRLSPLTAFIGRLVVNIPNIGLPNIVVGRRIMPELLQEEMTPANMAGAVLHLLEPAEAQRVRQDIEEVKKRLGAPGAVRRVAELTYRVAGEKT